MADSEPVPITPPILPPRYPGESAAGEKPHGGEWELNCAKTRIIRVYSNQTTEGTISVNPKACDKKHRYWVDVEVIDLIDLKGAQWKGPDGGNLTQKTLQELNPEQNGNKGNDLVLVVVKKGVDPNEKEDDQAGSGDGEWGQDDDDITVHARNCMKMVTRQWGVERTFRNKMEKPGQGLDAPGQTQPGLQSVSMRARSNDLDVTALEGEGDGPPAITPPVSPTDPENQPKGGGGAASQSTGEKPNFCRQGQKWRIQFNNIDDDLLDGGQPPSVPKEYKQAVSKSADNAPLFLHVEVATEATMMRGKGLGRVHVKFQDFWKDGKIDLPGAKSSGGGKESKEPHIRLDPYQVIINFGPDGLAVELDGTGNPSGSSGGGGGGGGALGGAFAGIGAGMMGGAVPAG